MYYVPLLDYGYVERLASNCQQLLLPQGVQTLLLLALNPAISFHMVMLVTVQIAG